jgi:hypothetical protein
MNLLAFFLQPRVLVTLALSIAIAGTGWYVKHLKNNIADQQQLVVVTQQKLYVANAQIIAERDKFKFTIDTMQNEYDSLKSKTAALQQRISVSDKKRGIIQREYDQRINRILQEPRPKTCSDAVKYLFDSSKELEWK